VAKLKKPPVVEVWLAIDIEPNPDGLPWGPPLAEEFLRKYRDEFEFVEVEHSQQVRVEQSGKGLPHVVEQRIELQRVKAFDQSRTHCLQVARDRVAFNSLRSGTDYPGYEKVYQEAEEKFAHYLHVFRPLSIRSASICYVDIINIPLAGKSSIELSDYFEIGSDLPADPFGPMTQYSVQAVLNCPYDKGPMVMTFRSLPGRPDFMRFYLECQKQCLSIDGIDLDVVRSRLQVSKDYVSDCFQKSFKPRGWQLFEPESTMD